MREKTGYSGGQIFLAFLGGAAVGATAALLTAPRSGAETRKTLMDGSARGRELASRIPEASRLAREAAKQTFVETMDN